MALAPLAAALAPATAQIGVKGAAGTHSRANRGRSSRRPTISETPAAEAATVIERFISVVPPAIWIAFAVSVGLAALAGGAAVFSGRRAHQRGLEIATVAATALTDPLTGVLNRRGFMEAAERELERTRRYEHPLALAYVDVRGLKTVNDSEGHLAGDELLKHVAALLRQSARAHDLIGRVGGDELAVLLPEQSHEGAAAMTRRVAELLPAHRQTLGFEAAWDVTIGTSTYPHDGETLHELMAAADRRLYGQRGIELHNPA